MEQQLNRLVLRTDAHPQTVFERVVKEIGSAELVEVVHHDFAGSPALLAVFEKFYLRVKSHVSVTLLLTAHDGQLVADVIASGGGEGFFNLFWDAKRDFAELIMFALNIQGFEVVDIKE